jgi:hypothetical protein
LREISLGDEFETFSVNAEERVGFEPTDTRGIASPVRSPRGALSPAGGSLTIKARSKFVELRCPGTRNAPWIMHANLDAED